MQGCKLCLWILCAIAVAALCMGAAEGRSTVKTTGRKLHTRKPKESSFQMKPKRKGKCRLNIEIVRNIMTADEKYVYYKRELTNCTSVVGNLILEGLDGLVDYDLSFLSSIRAISGYLSISSVYASRIPLTSLVRVRGKQLKAGVHWAGYPASYTKDYQAAIYVSDTTEDGNVNVGLQYLLLPKLKRIHSGDVVIGPKTERLCHTEGFKSAFLYHIMKDDNAEFLSSPHQIVFDLQPCKPCHHSCAGQCWGPGKDNCLMKRFRRRPRH